MSSYLRTETVQQSNIRKRRDSPNWIRITFFLLLGALAMLAMYQLSDILQLVVLAALFSYLLDPAVTWVESWGINRSLATLAMFLFISVVLTFTLFFLLPVAIEQLSQLQTGPIIDQLEIVIADLQSRIEVPLAQVGINDLDLLTSFKTYVTNFLRDTINYVPNVLAMLSNFLLIPFMMFFIIKDGNTIKKGFIGMVPNRYFEFSLNVLQKMDLQLGNYLRGQFLIAFIDGTIITTALWLLGVDFFLVIGPIAGLANLIPYVGPFIGLIPALLGSILSTGNFDTIPAIIILFLCVQLLDSSFMQPLILAKNVELHPLAVLLAILVGGKLFGIIGLLMAVPFTAILKVIIQETITNMRRYHLS